MRLSRPGRDFYFLFHALIFYSGKAPRFTTASFLPLFPGSTGNSSPAVPSAKALINASIYSIINYVATKNILNAPYPSRTESKSVTDACFMRHAGRRHAKDERESTKSTAQARCAQGIVTGGVTTPK